MEKRNLIGIVSFFLLSLVFGIAVLPVMVAREIYQYIKYLRPCGLSFEWNDILRYGITIGIGCLLHWFCI